MVHPTQWQVRISWAVSDESHVRVAVFNSAGEFVVNLWDGDVAGGEDYYVDWDGKNSMGNPVTSNVYIIRLFAPALLLLKTLAVVQ